MNDGALAEFAKGLRGLVIARNHPDYQEARKLYNAMIDKRPRAIARCSDVADVMAAINFARDNKLPIAVRGGGHNGPGFGSIDDGLVIDLSMMKGVRVDPAKRTVRVGAGCVTGDVDHATGAFGQAVPFGVVSTTGVSGLTLSGGHAISAVNTVSPWTICLRLTWCWPTAGSLLPRRLRTRTCFGRYAVAAETSVS